MRGSERECWAEYLTAVSRLADSGCSCSECTMRGGQCAQETAVKEQKGKKERKREQVHVCANASKCARFCLFVICIHPWILAGMRACMCASANAGDSLAVW